VRVWDALTGHALTEPLIHDANALYAEFSPDGRYVVTASADGTARIWEVGSAVLPIPTWLPDLAEAVAGRRIGPQEMSVTLAVGDLYRLKEKLRSLETQGYYETWVQWFLADLGHRRVSPSAHMSMSEYVEYLVNCRTEESLRLALTLDPACLEATLRLAVLLANEPDSVGWDLGEVEFLSRQGLREAPNDPAVRSLRVRLLMLSQQWESALAASDEFWELLRHGVRADPKFRKQAIKDRIEILRALGRAEEAGGVGAAALAIPDRAAFADAGLIDLTPFCNATLDEDWHNPQDRGNNLASLRDDSLPDGLLELGGVRFDARGIVQLSSTELRNLDPSYPERIDGIAVAQTARRIHFLHGVGWLERDGIEVARYIVHFDDGAQAEVPVVYGEHVRNWQFWPEGVAGERGGAEPVWRGPQERWRTLWPNAGVRLYRTTWVNPRPDVAIRSLDFISTMTTSAPFLIAVTVE